MMQHGADLTNSVPQYYAPNHPITPLLWAIKYKQHAAFDWLVAQGISLDDLPHHQLASTPMHALYYGSDHALAVLLEKGIAFQPINLATAVKLIVADAPIQHADVDGDTPLHEIVYAIEKITQIKHR